MSVFVVVAAPLVGFAGAGVGVICFCNACGQFALYGKAAVAVVVEAADGRAVAVLLDGEDAAVRAVPR